MNQPVHAASAALRRTNLTTHGYFLELGLANTGSEPIIGWSAELTMPSDASLEPAPGHEVLVVPVVDDVWTVSPARATTVPAGHRAVLEIAVRCTRDAPLAVQFTAQCPSAKVFAAIDVIAVHSEGESATSDALTWPGSRQIDTGLAGHLPFPAAPSAAGPQSSSPALTAPPPSGPHRDSPDDPWADWLGDQPNSGARDAARDRHCDRLGRSNGQHKTDDHGIASVVGQLAVANMLLSRIAAAAEQRPMLDAPSSIQVETLSDGSWYVRWAPVIGATRYHYQHPYGAGTTTEAETPGFTIPAGRSRTCVIRAQRGETIHSPWVAVAIDVDDQGRLRQLRVSEAIEPLELSSD